MKVLDCAEAKSARRRWRRRRRRGRGRWRELEEELLGNTRFFGTVSLILLPFPFLVLSSIYRISQFREKREWREREGELEKKEMGAYLKFRGGPIMILIILFPNLRITFFLIPS